MFTFLKSALLAVAAFSWAHIAFSTAATSYLAPRSLNVGPQVGRPSSYCAPQGYAAPSVAYGVPQNVCTDIQPLGVPSATEITLINRLARGLLDTWVRPTRYVFEAEVALLESDRAFLSTLTGYEEMQIGVALIDASRKFKQGIHLEGFQYEMFKTLSPELTVDLAERYSDLTVIKERPVITDAQVRQAMQRYKREAFEATARGFVGELAKQIASFAVGN